jgi:hypothetical protein
VKYFVFVADVLQGTSREIVGRMILCDFRSYPIAKFEAANFQGVVGNAGPSEEDSLALLYCIHQT